MVLNLNVRRAGWGSHFDIIWRQLDNILVLLTSKLWMWLLGYSLFDAYFCVGIIRTLQLNDCKANYMCYSVHVLENS